LNNLNQKWLVRWDNVIILLALLILINITSAQSIYNGSSTVSPRIVSQGQNVIITDTLPSQGGMYHYQWVYRYMMYGQNITGLISANSICTPASGNAYEGQRVQCIFSTSLETHPGAYAFGLQVTNRTTTLYTSNSSSVFIPVYSAISLEPLKVSNQTIDLGQPAIIAGNLSTGGTGAFTYQWLASYGSNVLESLDALQNNITGLNIVEDNIAANYFYGFQSSNIVACILSTSTPGTYRIELQVKDVFTNETANSTPVTITVVNKSWSGNMSFYNRLFTIGQLLTNNSLIYTGESSKISINLPQKFEGIPPYSYKWLVCYPNNKSCVPYSKNNTNFIASKICSPASGTVIPGDTLTCVFSTNSSTAIGDYIFYFQVTDNRSQVILSSSPTSIIVLPIPPTFTKPPNVEGPRIIDQYQSTTISSIIPGYNQSINQSIETTGLAYMLNNFQVLWLYSYNGSSYSSARFTSAPSLCTNGQFNNMIPESSPIVNEFTPGEQVNCTFSPTGAALPGVYNFELGLIYENTHIIASPPSPPIIVNPALLLVSVNVSSNETVFGHSFNITAKLSKPYKGTPPYTYKLDIFPLNTTKPIYTAVYDSPSTSYTFKVNSSYIGVGKYRAKVTVTDDAQIPESYSLLSSNFTILNNLNTTNLISANSNVNNLIFKAPSSIPLPPPNLIAISVLNITAKNETNTYVIEKFPCGQYKSIRPFILENGTWQPINKYIINKTSCTVTFSVPSDPIVGLMTNRTSTSFAPLNVTLTQNITTENKSENVLLIANVSGGSGSYVYNWYNNFGLINRTNSGIIKLSIKSAGTYEYYVIVNDLRYNTTGKSNIIVVTFSPALNESNSNSITGSTIVNKTLIPSKESLSSSSLGYLEYIILVIVLIIVIIIIAKFKKKFKRN